MMRAERLRDLRVGAELPALSAFIDRAAMERFGELIEDRNPVHFDDEFAQKKGFAAAIAHSAVGSSLLLRMLTKFLGAWPIKGDHIDISYRSPVLVGDTLTARGICKERQAGAVICDVWCENQNGQKVIKGAARFIEHP